MHAETWVRAVRRPFPLGKGASESELDGSSDHPALIGLLAVGATRGATALPIGRVKKNVAP